MTGHDLHELEQHVRKVMQWELRMAMHLSWWEKAIERTGWWERWEWQTPDGRWVRFWRRDGRLPA